MLRLRSRRRLGVLPEGRAAAYLTHLLALAQTLVIAQAAIGLLLLSSHHRAMDKLHYLYGGVALLAVLSPWMYAPSDRRGRLAWFTGATLVAGRSACARI